MMSKHEYMECMNFLRCWNITTGHVNPPTGQHLTNEEFERLHNNKWFRLAQVFQVVTSRSADGTVVDQLKRYDKGRRAGRLVVHQENAFDAIHECHLAVGHKKIIATRNKVAQNYWNLTEELCKIFLSGCPECCNEAANLNKQADTRTPKCAGQFRARFEADLVDYRSNPQCDPNEVEMKWLLVLQDHFTRFTMLRPIARKEAELVAYELSLMFGVLGYPLVFHMNDGDDSEFTSELVMNLIHDWIPACRTVTGRGTKLDTSYVKAMIARLEQQERNNGNNDPNWVLLCASAMSAINSSTSSPRHPSSYEQVTRMEYSLPLMASIAEIRKAKNLKNLDKLLNSPRIHQKMVALGELAVNEEDNMSEDDSVSTQNSENS